MKVSELISKLQAIQNEEGSDAEVVLAIVDYDRYGNYISLVSKRLLDSDDESSEAKDEDRLISGYFGSEIPMW